MDLYTLFQKPGSIYWVAEDGGKIIGGCGIFSTENLPEGCGELVKLYLDPLYRNKGIGKQLMELSMESAKQLHDPKASDIQYDFGRATIADLPGGLIPHSPH